MPSFLSRDLHAAAGGDVSPSSTVTPSTIASSAGPEEPRSHPATPTRHFPVFSHLAQHEHPHDQQPALGVLPEQVEEEEVQEAEYEGEVGPQQGAEGVPTEAQVSASASADALAPSAGAAAEPSPAQQKLASAGQGTVPGDSPRTPPGAGRAKASLAFASPARKSAARLYPPASHPPSALAPAVALPRTAPAEETATGGTAARSSSAGQAHVPASGQALTEGAHELDPASWRLERASSAGPALELPTQQSSKPEEPAVTALTVAAPAMSAPPESLLAAALPAVTAPAVTQPGAGPFGRSRSLNKAFENAATALAIQAPMIAPSAAADVAPLPLTPAPSLSLEQAEAEGEGAGGLLAAEPPVGAEAAGQKVPAPVSTTAGFTAEAAPRASTAAVAQLQAAAAAAAAGSASVASTATAKAGLPQGMSEVRCMLVVRDAHPLPPSLLVPDKREAVALADAEARLSQASPQGPQAAFVDQEWLAAMNSGRQAASTPGSPLGLGLGTGASEPLHKMKLPAEGQKGAISADEGPDSHGSGSAAAAAVTAALGKPPIPPQKHRRLPARTSSVRNYYDMLGKAAKDAQTTFGQRQQQQQQEGLGRRDSSNVLPSSPGTPGTTAATATPAQAGNREQAGGPVAHAATGIPEQQQAQVQAVPTSPSGGGMKRSASFNTALHQRWKEFIAAVSEASSSVGGQGGLAGEPTSLAATVSTAAGSTSDAGSVRASKPQLTFDDDTLHALAAESHAQEQQQQQHGQQEVQEQRAENEQSILPMFQPVAALPGSPVVASSPATTTGSHVSASFSLGALAMTSPSAKQRASASTHEPQWPRSPGLRRSSSADLPLPQESYAEPPTFPAARLPAPASPGATMRVHASVLALAATPEEFISCLPEPVPGWKEVPCTLLVKVGGFMHNVQPIKLPLVLLRQGI